MSLRPFNHQPLYEQVRDVLVGRIASGHWKPGDALPNETALSHEFGLSPGTIRKALEWMENARVIVRQQGRGTFVRDPSSEEFVNWYERLRGNDGSPIHDKVETVEILEVAASDEECLRLHLSGGERVRRTKRHRIAGGHPYMIEQSTVPCTLFPLSESEQQADMPLLELAKRCHVVLGGGEERITALPAGADAAQILNCPIGEPLLRLDRLVYTITGQPAKWRVGFCRLQDRYYSAAIGITPQA